MHRFIYVSKITDGTMKTLNGDSETAAVNRKNFLTKNDIDPTQATLLHLLYGGDDYCRYKTLDATYHGDGIIRETTLDVDGLVATQPGHAMLLPLADCIGAVLYDETKNVLMLTHLGRHNLEQYGGTESVKYLVNQHAVNPKDLQVWLSPAAGKNNYPLFAFDNRSLHDVAVEQITAAGVPASNIEVSPVDTTIDTTYFSHSEFLKGHRDIDGRFCVVAVMK